jgi:Flp pilus assembly protein TadD/c-di-GMP-binding flagellar brake protein YcgR
MKKNEKAGWAVGESAGDVSRARELWAAGDLANALTAYRMALDSFPIEYPLYQETAAVLFQLGRLDDSARYFQAYLQSEENDPRAWNDLGVLRFEQNRFGEAVTAFERAVRLDRGNGEYLCNLANGLMEKGDHRASVLLLQKILKTRPTEGRAHCLLGIELADPAMQWRTGEVEVGQPIIVMRHTWFSGTAGNQEWKSRVENVTGDSIRFSLPTSGWKTMPLRKGTRVILGFEAPDAFWGAVAEVTDFLHDNIPLVEVRHAPSFKRVQRRADVRITPAGTIRKVTVVDAGPGAAASPFLGGLPFEEDNMSAAGTGFLVRHPVSMGARVLLDLFLEGELLTLEGRVVRKIPRGEGTDLIGVAFFDVDDRTHERLARHVLRVQLERRKKSNR